MDTFVGAGQIGMTAAIVRESLGDPDAINRTVKADTVREQWVYRNQRLYLYLDDGLLTTYQETE